MERVLDDYNWIFRFIGRVIKDVINMGFYNFFGFVVKYDEFMRIIKDVLEVYGIGVVSIRYEMGILDKYKELEDFVVKFLNVEVVMVFGMGFVINLMNILVLVGKGCFILSDELNYILFVFGV